METKCDKFNWFGNWLSKCSFEENKEDLKKEKEKSSWAADCVNIIFISTEVSGLCSCLNS